MVIVRAIEPITAAISGISSETVSVPRSFTGRWLKPKALNNVDVIRSWPVPSDI